MRKRDYSERDLFSASGRYGAWNVKSISIMAVGALIGWGFVTNPFASWLNWQGYFLGVIGGKEGQWAGANLGVLFALAIGSIGYLLLNRKNITRQENTQS
jgi:hypothetical protein